jgi:transposase-like protein
MESCKWRREQQDGVLSRSGQWRWSDCGRSDIGRLCEELGVSPCTLKKWRKQAAARQDQQAVTVQLPGETLEHENRLLKRALAETVLEVDSLQDPLQQVEARRRQNTAVGAGGGRDESALRFRPWCWRIFWSTMLNRIPLVAWPERLLQSLANICWTSWCSTNLPSVVSVVFWPSVHADAMG